MTASAVGLVIILTASVFAAPLAVAAQPAGRPYWISFLAAGSPGPSAGNVDQFRQGLRELGYTEGQSVLIDANYPQELDARRAVSTQGETNMRFMIILKGEQGLRQTAT